MGKPMIRNSIPEVLLLVLLLGAGTVWAQDKDADGSAGNGAGQAAAESNTREALQNRLLTQQELDQWSAEKSELVGRLRSARAAVNWLNERKLAESARVESLDGRLHELNRRLAESDRLESSMQDSLLVILRRVEESRNLGLPFLPEERDQRLAMVAGELARPDFTAAEKLRRVLEVLQVETDYANSVEVYQGHINVNDQGLYADILRIGRVALFWQTPDGERVGWFDQALGQWTDLPSKEKRNIGRAIEMATRMRPVELIDLPIGRISPTGQTSSTGQTGGSE